MKPRPSLTHPAAGRLPLALFVAAVAGMSVPAFAQHAPQARGSLDAVTVLPTTAPAGAPAATLPAGHPHLGADSPESTQSMHAGMPTAAKTGAVRIIVSQGTPGGPPIGREAATVELLSKGVPLKTYHTTVDEKGIIEIHDLPLDVPFQPVVTILHGGAEQQRVGSPMHKYQPAIEFDMPLYETTAEKPAWTIGLRDVEAQAVPVEGNASQVVLRLTDMFGGFNPSDRAWTGEQVGDSRQILAVPLPEGAINVQFGPGMAEAGAKVVHNAVIRGKTMLPGSTQYLFACDLPVKEGKATVSFTAPADTTLFALYIPGTWTVEKLTGLEAGASSGAHAAGKARLLKARNIKAGAVVSAELSGIKPPAPPATAPGQMGDQSTDLNLPKAPGK